MMERVLTLLAAAAGAFVGCYAGYVALTYARYGQVRRLHARTLLDSLMPEYEVSEAHSVRVQAAASAVMAAAGEISFQDSPLVRAIFALRDLPSRLAGHATAPMRPVPILEETAALGWRKIGEEPGRMVVMGAVAQPWKQSVEFHGLSSGEFEAFHEPGWAKIAWTLEAEPLSSSACVFRTQTRVATTDPASREKFRRYWSLLSPGIILIRLEALRLVKSRAQSRQGKS